MYYIMCVYAVCIIIIKCAIYYTIYRVGNVYCCCDAGNQVPVVNYVAGNLANILPARSLM